MYSRLKVGDSSGCPCGEPRQDASHILQDCTLFKEARDRVWNSECPLWRKLYGSRQDLEMTAAYIRETIHEVWQGERRRRRRLNFKHNRLRQHMYKRFKVGDSEICPCGQAPQNTEHVLQTCSSHKQLRARTWPNHTPLEKKLLWHNRRTCPDSGLHCGIGSHCLTDSCRKNEEEEEEETQCCVSVHIVTWRGHRLKINPETYNSESSESVMFMTAT